MKSNKENIVYCTQRHHNTDNDLLQFLLKHNAEVKDLLLSPFIGCGVATPRQFLLFHKKSDITMQNLHTDFNGIVWKDITGYEGLYKISLKGHVISLKRKYNPKERVLNIHVSDGYANVCLSKNNTHKTFSLHRLLCKAFIPNPENKPQVNHINGIKHDNHLENLEWCTGEENISHYNKYLLYGNSIKDRNVLKPINQLSNNGNIIAQFKSISEASRELKIAISAISKVANNKQAHAHGFNFQFI